MSEHTPGPWEVQYGYPTRTGHEYLVFGPQWGSDGGMIANQADAALIAAAPDMLEACENSLRMLKTLGDNTGWDTSGYIEQNIAAIAKAKGESRVEERVCAECGLHPALALKNMPAPLCSGCLDRYLAWSKAKGE